MTPADWFVWIGLAFLAGSIFHVPWLITVTIAMAVTTTIAALWQSKALEKVTYRRKWNYRRGFPGEKLQLVVTVNNAKKIPLPWLQAEDQIAIAIAPEHEPELVLTNNQKIGLLVNTYTLRWNHQIRRSYTLLLRERGVHRVGEAELEAGDIFGFFRRRTQAAGQEYITVFPELLPLPAIHVPTEDPFGDRKAPRRLFEDPTQTMGIRAYNPEDEFRRIHWPATARTGQLQVKVFQPVSARVMVICLNATTSKSNWWITNPDIFERMVKTAATLCYQGIQTGYSVGLISNGSLSETDQTFRILPGRSQEHLATLLRALAGIPAFSACPFEKFLINTLTDLPLGATLLIITASISPEMAETMLRLKRYRAHTTILSLEESAPPDIPGIRIIHAPYSPEGQDD